MDSLFSSVLGTTESAMTTMTSTGYFMCTLSSLVLGLLCAFIYMYKHNYSKNFVVTLALLPVIVQMVITLVNGNLGAGVAVMGVFNLTVVVGVFNIIYVTTPFGTSKQISKSLKITVPEDMQFEGMFDETLKNYTSSYDLVNVQTTNMGSLYQIEYNVAMKEAGLEKSMIDELRCLNGNLKISLGLPQMKREVL